MKKVMFSNEMDAYLTEIWSYMLYKRGKKMIGDIDPGSRIRKGIWRDEGMDITRFREIHDIGLDPQEIDWMLDTGRITSRRGLFRRKEEHMVVRSTVSLGSKLDESKGDDLKKRMEQLTSSDILFPYALDRIVSSMDEVIPMITVKRRPQRDHGNISPTSMMRREEAVIRDPNETENIRKSFNKASKGSHFTTPSGHDLKSLKEIFTYLMSCEGDELSGIIREASLISFASRSITSDVFEALFRDLSTDPEGDPETPSGFRARLGRWSLESPIGDQVTDEIVPVLLRRLLSCSEAEAINLEESLHTLMDPRSTMILTEMIFGSDPEKRQHLIRLLGSTRDRSAIETLKRLRDFSNVEDDRNSAREALEALGTGD